MGFNVCSKYVWDVGFWGVNIEFVKVKKYSSFPVSLPIVIIFFFLFSILMIIHIH